VEHDRLIQESDELRRIVSTMIRNNASKGVKKPGGLGIWDLGF
jgi:hypothetical protein